MVSNARRNGDARSLRAPAPEALQILRSGESEFRNVAVRLSDRERKDVRCLDVFGVRAVCRDGPGLLSGSCGETMSKPKEQTSYEGAKTISIELSIIGFDCLTRLLRTGLYGATIEEVAARLIEERLRGMVEMKR